MKNVILNDFMQKEITKKNTFRMGEIPKQIVNLQDVMKEAYTCSFSVELIFNDLYYRDEFHEIHIANKFKGKNEKKRPFRMQS